MSEYCLPAAVGTNSAGGSTGAALCTDGIGVFHGQGHTWATKIIPRQSTMVDVAGAADDGTNQYVLEIANQAKLTMITFDRSGTGTTTPVGRVTNQQVILSTAFTANAGKWWAVWWVFDLSCSCDLLYSAHTMGVQQTQTLMPFHGTRPAIVATSSNSVLIAFTTRDLGKQDVTVVTGTSTGWVVRKVIPGPYIPIGLVRDGRVNYIALTSHAPGGATNIAVANDAKGSWTPARVATVPTSPAVPPKVSIAVSRGVVYLLWHQAAGQNLMKTVLARGAAGRWSTTALTVTAPGSGVWNQVTSVGGKAILWGMQSGRIVTSNK